MTKKCVVFVDVGYLITGGMIAASGQRVGRTNVSLDVDKTLELLNKIVTDLGAELLRIYWYDGLIEGVYSREQHLVSMSPRVKFRAGRVNMSKKQKGVDVRIVLDMCDLARNHAMDCAIVISGDEDILPGILGMQEYGVTVDLYTIAGSGISTEMMREADHIMAFESSEVKSIFKISEIDEKEDHVTSNEPVLSNALETPSKIQVDSTTKSLEFIRVEATRMLSDLSDTEKQKAIEHFRAKPNSFLYDGRFLAVISAQLGRQLLDSEKHAMRDIAIGHMRAIV